MTVEKVTIDERRGEQPLALFYQRKQPWTTHALCKAHPDLFYVENPEGGGTTGGSNPYKEARALCASCPVRAECGFDALEEEKGLKEDMRSGLRAYMTPAQRVSIERRGGLRPGQDPMQLVLGRDGKRKVPTVPDEGDRWSRHHTTLARKTMRYLEDNVAIGAKLPTQSKLCELLDCNPAPLRRVMEALVQEGTLDFSGTKAGSRGANGATVSYVRRRASRAIGSWTPNHIQPVDEGVPCD